MRKRTKIQTAASDFSVGSGLKGKRRFRESRKYSIFVE